MNLIFHIRQYIIKIEDDVSLELEMLLQEHMNPYKLNVELFSFMFEGNLTL